MGEIIITITLKDRVSPQKRECFDSSIVNGIREHRSVLVWIKQMARKLHCDPQTIIFSKTDNLVWWNVPFLLGDDVHKSGEFGGDYSIFTPQLIKAYLERFVEKKRNIKSVILMHTELVVDFSLVQ